MFARTQSVVGSVGLLVLSLTLSAELCFGQGCPNGPAGGTGGSISVTSGTASGLSSSSLAYPSARAMRQYQQYMLAQQQYARQMQIAQLIQQQQRLDGPVLAQTGAGGAVNSSLSSGSAVMATEQEVSPQQQKARLKNAEAAMASARRSEQAGNVTAAVKNYRRVTRIVPGTPLGEEAAERLAALNAK